MTCHNATLPCPSASPKVSTRTPAHLAAPGSPVDCSHGIVASQKKSVFEKFVIRVEGMPEGSTPLPDVQEDTGQTLHCHRCWCEVC